MSRIGSIIAREGDQESPPVAWLSVVAARALSRHHPSNTEDH